MGYVDINKLVAHPIGKFEGLPIVILLGIGSSAVTIGSGSLSFGLAFLCAGFLCNWWVVLILRRMHKLIDSTEREKYLRLHSRGGLAS